MFLVGPAVKKVTYDDQLLWHKKLYLRNEALKVFFKNCLRNGNTAFSEMPALAKVQVRKNECFFFFPKKTAFMT